MVAIKFIKKQKQLKISYKTVKCCYFGLPIDGFQPARTHVFETQRWPDW